MEQKVCNEDLYEEVARELDIPVSLVKEVVHAQSLFTLDTIKRGKFESVRYVYLGKITVKVRKLRYMMKRQQEKQNDTQSKYNDSIDPSSGISDSSSISSARESSNED